MTVTAFVGPKLRTLKTWFDKGLKSLVSEDPLSTVQIFIKALWSDSSITAKEIELEKVSLIDMQNLGSAC